MQRRTKTLGNAAEPRGLVWSAPPELEVVCWNLRLAVGPDFAVRADYLMRPTVIDMIWEKQRLESPAWQPYDSLARMNSASLIPSVNWNPLDRSQDDTTYFSLFGFDRRGARRISYVGLLRIDSTKPASTDHVLTLDFNPILLQKLFCWLDIHVDTSLMLQSCDLVPTDSRKPTLRTQDRLQFASMTLDAVKLMRVGISRK